MINEVKRKVSDLTVFASSLANEKMMEIMDALFSKIIGFSLPLQNQGIMNSDYLTRIEEMKAFQKKSLLTHDKIDELQRGISISMTNAYPQLKTQLTAYWNAWATIFKNNQLESVNIREKVDQYLTDMNEIDSMYKETLDQKPETNNVALYSVLFLHILKTEKIEHPMMKDLKLYSDHIEEFDLDFIFSAGEKMPNSNAPTGFKTHSRAIRDAIAHKKFTIQEKKGQKQIVFKNNGFGYSFRETFTIDEFIHYIQMTDMLYRMMFVMQDLMILSTLLHMFLDRNEND